MWKWQKPSLVTIWKDLAFSIPSSSFDYVHTFRLQYCHHRRRQALVRGIVAPSWPKNSFILTIETTKNRGWAPRHHLETIKWLTSPREPSPGKIPAYAPDCRHRNHIFWARTKSVGRNFSREGLQASPREGFQPFFTLQDSIFGRFNGQNERILGPEGHSPPLSMAACAHGSYWHFN